MGVPRKLADFFLAFRFTFARPRKHADDGFSLWHENTHAAICACFSRNPYDLHRLDVSFSFLSRELFPQFLAKVSSLSATFCNVVPPGHTLAYNEPQ